MIDERQKPTNQNYLDHYDQTFGARRDFDEQIKLAYEVVDEILEEEREFDAPERHVPYGKTVHFVDEIVGTSAYIKGKLQAKQEGHTYLVLPRSKSQVKRLTMQGQFCMDCGAGLGEFRRAGEGVCVTCDDGNSRKLGNTGGRVAN